MLSNKIIRCHIHDRQDQVEECTDRLEYLNGCTAKLEQAVADAQTALQENAEAIARTIKLKTDIEATLHIDWLNDPPY